VIASGAYPPGRWTAAHVTNAASRCYGRVREDAISSRSRERLDDATIVVLAHISPR
jgi:hypothetical protein